MSSFVLARDLRPGHILKGGYKVLGTQRCTLRDTDTISVQITHARWPSERHVSRRLLDPFQMIEVLR